MDFVSLHRRHLLTLAFAALTLPALSAPPRPLPASDQALVERARDYLRGLSSAMGRFTQTDPRGRTTTGTVYLRRPGRARFEYDPPSGLVVASNGFRVAVLDKRLGTLDAYPLGATPLGILLSRDIRIDKSVAIGAVNRHDGGFSIVAHAANKRGQGQIALEFTEAPLSLAGWTITDAQGGLTKVKLANFGPSQAMPKAFFELAPDRSAPHGRAELAVRLRIATWNVNSVRLRAEQAARFIAEQAPDVLCLQEIKCQAGEFPRAAFEAAGLPHIAINGQKGWHGVAIASRLPLEAARPLDLCREGHARCVSVGVAGIEIHNLYIPAGGDIPDRAENPKFDHKLDFYARLTAEMATRDPARPLILAGDFNVAPGENDVWNHKFMSKVVSHTPPEIEAMAALKASLRFLDPMRETVPEPAKLASWWSYRAADFRVSNRGLRLDHIWLTPALLGAARHQGAWAARIHNDVRAWERPSDHAPVSVDLGI